MELPPGQFNHVGIALSVAHTEGSPGSEWKTLFGYCKSHRHHNLNDKTSFCVATVLSQKRLEVKVKVEILDGQELKS
jgi:hypothetical protein